MFKLLVMMGTLALSGPVLAQQGPSPAPPAASDEAAQADLTILVSGVAQNVDQSGQSISLFDRGAMDAIQGADLTRLLERSPGVSATRNGGPGAFTSLHVRGAEGEQLLVLIDGVRLADPASPSGGFDLGNLLMGNLAKVELQRSSNSTIWGSDAIGGVLAATTGTTSRFDGSIEYGAYDTLFATAGSDFALGPASISLQAAHYRSDGFSAAASGSEPDEFRQSELDGNGTVKLGGHFATFVRARYADGRVDLDGFPAPAFTLADTDEFQQTRQLSGVAGLHYADSVLDMTVDGSAAQTRRANFDPSLGSAPTFTADGVSQRAELRGQWKMARGLALDFGGEHEWTRFSTLFDARSGTAITGGYAQLEYDGGPLHLAAGVRRDEHRDFGGHWSLGADAAYRLSPRWRLTASYGEGFKAPTLFQLHSDYGNGALRPETSRSYDAGIAYASGDLSAKLTAFRRDTRDLIAFVSCFGLASGICTDRPFGTYDNTGRARAQGVELEGAARLGEHFRTTAAYTYLEAIDRTPGSLTEGNDLARRPRSMLTLSGDWRQGGARLGADVRKVSHSFDDAANAVRLDGYTLVTLRGEWDATQHVTLYGRVENVGDEKYQTAAGYGTAGRSAYLGARARF